MSASWRTKYLDIRAKLKSATDVAYRLGMEEGLKQAQMQQVQEQQQQQEMAMQQAAAQNGGMPPEEGGMPPEAMGGEEQGQMDEGPAPLPQDMGEEDGSELDQHIGELESLVKKGEKPSVLDIRKVVTTISDIRKSQKDQWRKKADETSSSQKRFVDGILKKWEKESKDVTSGLEDILQESGVKLTDGK
jgi:hypothetical protein